MNLPDPLHPPPVHPPCPSMPVPAIGSILFTEVTPMNRRKFLGSTLKAISCVSCAPFYTGALPALVPQQSPSLPPRSSSVQRPQLAITIDDPRLKLEGNLRWPDANSRILKALESRNLRA